EHGNRAADGLSLRQPQQRTELGLHQLREGEQQACTPPAERRIGFYGEAKKRHGLVAADIEETYGERSVPQRRGDGSQLGEQLRFRRRPLARQVELFDAKQADAIGAEAERRLDILMDSEIGFDSNQLAVQSARRQVAGSLATAPRRVVLVHAGLELGTRFRIRGDDNFTSIRIDQHFVAIANVLQNVAKSGGRENALLSVEQRRVRALP